MSQDSCKDEECDSSPSMHSIETKECQNAQGVASSHQKPSKYSRLKKLTAFNVWFNGILAFTTLCLMVIAYWQLDATNQAIQISQSANAISKESLRVSQESYRISKEAADDSARNFHLEQRAWVSARNADMTTFKIGEVPRIKVVLTNSGRTPARKTKTIFGIAIANREILDQDLLQFDNMNTSGLYQGIMTMLPNGLMIVHADSDEKMTTSSMDDIKSGKRLVFVFGKITYADVFNNVRTTRMCMRYRPLTNSFDNCSVYNDAD